MIIDFSLTPLKKAIEGEIAERIATCFADVDYVASAKTIYFYNGDDDVVGTVDATDFLVDGMIDSVTLSGSNLIIVFNTDAGKETITIDLTEFINPELYWTSAQTKTYADSADTIIYASGVSYTDGKIAEVYASGVSYADDAIAEAIAAESARCESTYIKEHQSLAAYWTSAETKTYVDSADTAIRNEIGELSGVVQEQQIVFSSGYNELHTQVMELSGVVGDQEVKFNDFYTSAQTEEAITSKGYITSAYTGFAELSGDVQTLSAATTGISSDLNTLSGVTAAAISTIPANPVQSTSVTTLWKGTQAEYDALAPDYDPNTFYIIIPSA